VGQDQKREQCTKGVPELMEARADEGGSFQGYSVGSCREAVLHKHYSKSKNFVIFKQSFFLFSTKLGVSAGIWRNY